MANFDEAYSILEDLEGFYTVDTGGQTWKGISRKFWPKWPGWKEIDRIHYEHQDLWVSAAKEDLDLENCVQDFYKEQFWNRIWGNEIKDQDIANELFEQAVNMGVHRAVTHLQKALNLLLSHDIQEDGIFGPDTMDELRIFISHSNDTTIHALLGVMNIYQGWHYITLASNPTTGYKYRKYLKGWVNRRVEV